MGIKALQDQNFSIWKVFKQLFIVYTIPFKKKILGLDTIFSSVSHISFPEFGHVLGEWHSYFQLLFREASNTVKCKMEEWKHLRCE